MALAIVLGIVLGGIPESVVIGAGLTQGEGVGASGVASALGYAALRGAGPGALAFVLTFTGGAVLAMLAGTMMPEAFEDAGRVVGLMTTHGFALAFGLSLAS